MTRNVLMISGLGAALLLAGCGSDSSSSGGADQQNVPPITTSPATGSEGSWQGTINSPMPNSRAMEAVVLGDGTVWLAYADATGEILNAAGLLTGKGETHADGTFTLRDATLLSLEDGNAKVKAGMSANYVTGSSFNGAISHSSLTPISLPASADFSTLYQMAYNNNLTLAHLAGGYNGSLTSNFGKQGATLTVKQDGVITGKTTSGDCPISGQAQARERSNVFNVSVSFGEDATCGENAGRSMSGVASLENGRVAVLAMDAEKAHSFVFIGRR